MIVKNMQFLLKLLKYSIGLNISAKVTPGFKVCLLHTILSWKLQELCVLSVDVHLCLCDLGGQQEYVNLHWHLVCQSVFLYTHTHVFIPRIHSLFLSLLLLPFDEIHHVFVWRKNYIDRNVHWWLLTSCGVQNSWKISGLRLTWQIEMYCH